MRSFKQGFKSLTRKDLGNYALLSVLLIPLMPVVGTLVVAGCVVQQVLMDPKEFKDLQS